MAGGRPSGEWPAQTELLKALAFEAADTAVTKALASRSSHDDLVLASINEIKSDMKQVLSQQARHDYQLGAHSEQLKALAVHRNQEPERIQEHAEAVARAVMQEEIGPKAREVAQAVVQQEIADRTKAKRSAWDSFLPGMIGSILATIFGAWILYTLTPKEPARDQQQVSQPQPNKTGNQP